MKTKVNQTINLAQKVLGLELRCSDVLGNGLCYANTALVALATATGHPVLRAIGSSIAILLAELNAWQDNAYPDVYDLINARLGGDAIYMLHNEDGQGLQELTKEIQDAKSKLRQCLYVVIQNPVCSEDVTYTGPTHFTVLTRDWSKWVGHLYAIVQSYKITPARLACQQRKAWTCMATTRVFMAGNTANTSTAEQFTEETSTTEQLTEEKAMRAVTRTFDACGTLMSCGTIDVSYAVLEDIALFTGIDIHMLITAGSDSKLHECIRDRVEEDNDLASPIVYDVEHGLTAVDVLARVAHREPYIQDIITSANNEGLTKYRTSYVIVITATGHLSW